MVRSADKTTVYSRFKSPEFGAIVENAFIPASVTALKFVGDGPRREKKLAYVAVKPPFMSPLFVKTQMNSDIAKALSNVDGVIYFLRGNTERLLLPLPQEMADDIEARLKAPVTEAQPLSSAAKALRVGSYVENIVTGERGIIKGTRDKAVMVSDITQF